MSNWSIIGIVYAVLVVAWCFFAMFQRDRIMSPKNSKGLNIAFLVISIIFAPICWCIGLVLLIQHLSRKKKKDWPEPVPKKFRNYLKKDTVFYKRKSMSLAAYNKLTGNNLTLEQIYGKKYVEALTEDDIRQFDVIGERSSIEF